MFCTCVAVSLRTNVGLMRKKKRCPVKENVYVGVIRCVKYMEG